MPTTERAIFNKGNQLFHVDSSFNPRRAGYVSRLLATFESVLRQVQSLLLAHELPPPGHGGNTEFADSRTAYDDLSEEIQTKIADWILWHSQHHSRRKASPDAKLLAEPRVR